MLKLIAYFTSLFLVSIIFLRLPRDLTGLTSFTTKSNILGSPSLAREILNSLTIIGILVYGLVAFQLNLANR
jgi:hypothetical protein